MLCWGKAGKMTRFIAIVAGKGGVGKTTTTLNLGTALANFGKDVIIVDANLSNPNLSIHLGSPKLPATLHDSLRGKMSIRDAAYLHPCGVRIIPSSIAFENTRNADYSNMHNVLLDLVGTTDIVLMDTPPGIGKDVEAVMRSADELIVVTTPEEPAVADAIKTIRLAEEVGTKVIGFISNRSSNDNFEVSVANMEALLDRPIIGVVPEDKKVSRAISMKHPVVYTHPDSPASIGFKKIAARLMGQEYRETLSRK